MTKDSNEQSIKYIKQTQTVLKGKTESIIIRQEHLYLTFNNRTTRKINKVIEDLKHYRQIGPKKHIQNTLNNCIHIFFSSTYKLFSRIEQMLGCKISLNTFKKTEIIQIFFYDHNGKKLEINSRRKTEKSTNVKIKPHVLKHK